MAFQGHISGVSPYEGASAPPEEFLWPDVISHDLAQHFPAYEQAKLHLLSEINTQDAEFRTALIDHGPQPTHQEGIL
jgi:hypothetical protein